MYRIVYSQGILNEVKGLRANVRKQILDKIHQQLAHEPARETRNKKPLFGLKPPWQHEEPVWELRIGSYRAFHDIDQNASVVTVRALRLKPPHKTSGEIL
jgi:mRNA-degrading endonuclease RelE of RelBE toxin-antitoxin system